jgi:UDP:flavonoid glycosyltransferase YjiC (YdhE family)
VTLGPALDPAEFHASPNVVLERFVPHAAVLPQVAVMVTQGGLSSVMKALAYGVPLVCVPLIADQPDNAARVVARGAGVRLAGDATPEQLRRAIQHVLAEPRFRDGTRTLATSLAGSDGAETAARELESLARVGQRP